MPVGESLVTQARVLIIDDEKFIVEGISQHLTALGNEVLPFVDPAKALEVIESEEIDLVLTDSESATRLLSLVWFRLINTIRKKAARLAAADAQQDD